VPPPPARDRTRLLALPKPHRRAVVVGSGHVAARRAAALTRSGTPVVVYAPTLCDDLFDLLAEHLVTWEDRWPTAEDLADAWLVHAATGDPDRDSEICALVAQRRATA
jgi:siroheme synthase-like protein